MRGLYWVTKSGDVVESTGDPMRAVRSRGGVMYSAAYLVVTVRRVGSDAFLGTRRLDKLRPATAAEVRKAQARS